MRLDQCLLFTNIIVHRYKGGRCRPYNPKEEAENGFNQCDTNKISAQEGIDDADTQEV